ncbi:MAG: hypothetical protein WCP85_31375, partial [Mariniphaga sp.]
KPGTLQLVVTYNESSGKWESYPNAVVNSDGKSASLTIYHFSEWTLMVEAGLPLTVVPITPVKVDYPVGGKFTWSSTLIFPNGILADFSPSFLYGFVSDQTGLAFANYKNGSVTVPIGTGTIQNTLTISPSPNTNPVGFTDLPNIAWELVKYSYTVQGKITVQAFDIPTNGYVNREITCTFELPSYVWIWKESPSLEYPPRPYPGNYKKISQVVLSMQHQGGVGW